MRVAELIQRLSQQSPEREVVLELGSPDECKWRNIHSVEVLDRESPVVIHYAPTSEDVT